MVFWKALEMPNIKIIWPSADAIVMMMWMELMPDTGEYEKVKSTTSRTDDTSAHVLEYISYWFSMPTIFTLKYILGLSIFVSGGNKECKMVHWMRILSFSHHLKILNSTSHIQEESWTHLQYDMVLEVL